MKKNPIILVAAFLFSAMLLFLNFVPTVTGSITGRIDPTDGASKVTIISTTDTASSTVIDGRFELRDLRAGVYAVHVEAIPPYKSTTRTDVSVTEGTATDLGTIILDKSDE